MKKIWGSLIVFCIAAISLGCLTAGYAQDTNRVADSTLAGNSLSAPVVFYRDTLFWVSARIGPFSPSERASAITERLERLSRDPSRQRDSVYVESGAGSSDIVSGDVVLATIMTGDALPRHSTHQALAAEYAASIQHALRVRVESISVKNLVIHGILALAITVVFMLALRLLARVLAATRRAIDQARGTRIRSVRIQTWEVIPADRMANVLTSLARILRMALVIILFYFYISLVFGLFPWTQGIAQRLFAYIFNPAAAAWNSFLNYLPNVFFIAVIVVITRVVLRFIRQLFEGVSRGTITLSGFYPDWAMPTYKIVRFLVIAFAAVIAFPYLPGSQSPAFKAIGVFLGVLFSLGSTSAVANAVAGTMLTYMRPFKIGDRVRIADTMGDVVEKTLLVTRVRTVKNVDVTIPNALVLGSHIINFSTQAQDRKLILHSTVTISYDAPWRKVHALLIQAARDTRFVLGEPAPFVLQTSLDDSYVSYEINAYTDHANEMTQTYAELHQNIQDRFNEAGVEIMSPHYTSVRDGNRTAIPDDYLPKNYRAPGFRITRPDSGE